MHILQVYFIPLPAMTFSFKECFQTPRTNSQHLMGRRSVVSHIESDFNIKKLTGI